jgi:hypothetical protein
MKYIIWISSILFISFQFNLLSAQKSFEYKFNEIKPEDFTIQAPVTDSGAEAIVLADVGSTEFEGNNNGYFTMIFKQHERILLKSRNAFEEATVKLTLYSYTSAEEEKLENLEASTYKLVNGKIEITKLEKSSVFKEKLGKYLITYKFTLPNLSEGCIIDYHFEIKSPFHNNNIRGWSFQGKYPVLWSDYKVNIPPFFNYLTYTQGYLPFTIDTAGFNFKNYTIIDAGDAVTSSTVYRLSGDAKWYRWAIKDIPAFKKESYLTTSANYVSKVNFQLLSIKYSDAYTKLILKDWLTTIKELINDEDFGLALSDKNGWLNDDMKRITNGGNGLEAAKKIFAYIRENFTCDDHDAIYLSQTLKKTFQTRKGNVADINLLLTACLLHESFDVHPVLISTRDHGFPKETISRLNQFNYVIAKLNLDSATYLLDASVPRLGFGNLPEDCYNGNGRLVDKMPYLIPVSADSLLESKFTLLSLINGGKEGLKGSMTTNLGTFESLKLRNELSKKKTEEYTKELQKNFSSDITVSNIIIDSLKNYEDPIGIKMDLNMKFSEDIVYFSPLLNGAWKNNPFISAERKYPVEMPYKINEMVTLYMEIPEGYKVDELPKSTRVKLNDDEGMFQYLTATNDGVVQVQVKLVLNKANFQPQDYATLRDFFTYVVEKESEQIVFKKK